METRFIQAVIDFRCGLFLDLSANFYLLAIN